MMGQEDKLGPSAALTYLSSKTLDLVLDVTGMQKGPRAIEQHIWIHALRVAQHSTKISVCS